MDPDTLKQAWQTQTSQTRLTFDAELLQKEVRRNQQYFNAMILLRDVREVGISLLLVPVWFYMGAVLPLPWTWYLEVPALLWVAGYMLADRMRHKRQPPEPGESLRQCVESSLAQVEHQVWLLRNVLWWYLLPLGIPILAFFGQVFWQVGQVASREDPAGGWGSALILLILVPVFAFVVAVEGIVDAFIYWLNQKAVRSELEPRRRELEALLMSLADEAPDSTRLTNDAELLSKEVRNPQWFNAMIFWRDVCEVGIYLLLVALWLYMGVKLSFPWTWYLMVPALLWIAGYKLAERMRHKRQPPEPGEPLRQRVESSLAEVEHQIRLHRNLLWSYLLPLGIPMLAFLGQAIGQTAWQDPMDTWWSTLLAAMLVFATVVAEYGLVFAGIYWLNQIIVRWGLEPRRRELETLLMSLADETPNAS